MDRLTEVASRRQADLAAVISHRLPLSDGVRAYHIFANRLEKCTKVVLYPEAT